MTEKDIPQRVVVVLLFLVILISFLGTLTVLQLYATAPRSADNDLTKATVSVGLLGAWKPAEVPAASDDSALVSIKINKYDG